MLTLSFFLVLATLFLAYANGANDNFKGVATLFGSRSTGYRTAIAWASVATFSGSVCSIFLARSLLVKFSGRGVVPDQMAGSEQFLLAVALGAGLTVIIATVLGLPVSTTHGLTGAILGTGLVGAGRAVNFQSVANGFLLPLVLGPLLAIALTSFLYAGLRLVRRRCGITKEWCICVGATQQVVPQPALAVVSGFGATESSVVSGFSRTLPALDLSAGEQTQCVERYAGTMLGVGLQTLLDGAHFVSAGLVSFARGLNDAPKIAAMLLTVQALDVRFGLVAIGGAMVIGGLLNAGKVAETMSHRITSITHGQGFAANVSTGLLVILASTSGLPVSTTHVSVGSLFGIGLTARTANIRVLTDIVCSWVLTLPCAALLGGGAYWGILHLNSNQ